MILALRSYLLQDLRSDHFFERCGLRGGRPGGCVLALAASWNNWWFVKETGAFNGAPLFCVPILCMDSLRWNAASIDLSVRALSFSASLSRSLTTTSRYSSHCFSICENITPKTSQSCLTAPVTAPSSFNLLIVL